MYRMKVEGNCVVSLETLERNVAHALTLGLPEIRGLSHTDGGPLAVVGGGHSAHDQLDTLRSWPGAIWAINGACRWLASYGIQSTLFSVDPEPCLAPLCEGVTDALLASHCAPEAFAALQGASVMMFHGHQWNDNVKALYGGTTSATRVPLPAVMLGHHEVSYFGCEGSFRETTHTFKDESAYGRQLIVRADGKDYRTTLQFMNQTETLVQIIKNMPHIFKDRSGGLLSAMLEHPDTWEVVALSEELAREADPTAIDERNRYGAAA